MTLNTIKKMIDKIKEFVKKFLIILDIKLTKFKIYQIFIYIIIRVMMSKKVQIYHNKRKIEKVFADKNPNRVGDILVDKFPNKPITGLCHGSRNGFEQNYLRDLSLGIEAIGTDISETVLSYENSLQLDFHDEKKTLLENLILFFQIL